MAEKKVAGETNWDERYVQLGVMAAKMGLDGENLVKFVTNSIESEREREHKERLEEEERDERKKDKKRIEKEEKEERRRKEEEEREEKLRKENEERDERQHRREIERLEREDKQKREENEFRLKELQLQVDKEYKEKLIELKESKSITIEPLSDGDDADAFIAHFEKIASISNWPDASLPTRLIALLRGKAKEAILNLTETELTSYPAVKSALLRYFRLDANAYRFRFRNCQKDMDESYPQYLTRIERYFDQWMIAAKKNPRSADDMKDLIIKEQFMRMLDRDMAAEVLKSDPGTTEQVAKQAEVFEQARKLAAPDDRVQNGLMSRVNDVQCYNCKEFGHKASSCKNNKVLRVGPKVLSEPSIQTPSLCNLCAEKRYDPRCVAIVNGMQAKAIRDTGAAFTVVAEKFVRPGDYTGENVSVVLASGVESVLPVARIQIVSPFVKGELEVLVMARPAEDVLIGNQVRGSKSQEDIPVYANPITVNAVQTRRIKLKENQEPQTLKKDDGIMPEVSTRGISEMQDKDETLARARELCSSGSKVVTRYGETSYFRKEGVLLRKYRGNKTEATQVCVPKQMRNTVLAIAHVVPMGGHRGIKKTSEMISGIFYWPGMFSDVRRYAQSCRICQRTFDRGRVPMKQSSSSSITRSLTTRPWSGVWGPCRPIAASSPLLGPRLVAV